MAASGTQPLRLVLDTNVVVAGQLWTGPPRRLIELAIEGEAVEFFSSPVLLDELAYTLGYSKFAARIEGFGTSIAVLVAHGAGQLGDDLQRAAGGRQRCR
jgi:putative PIN family toxin of toxin-antitoxin system